MEKLVIAIAVYMFATFVRLGLQIVIRIFLEQLSCELYSKSFRFWRCE